MNKRFKSLKKNKQQTKTIDHTKNKKSNIYKADDLVCAHLLTVFSEIEDDKDDYGPKYEETDLLYFFKKEVSIEGKEIKFTYEEVFTKFKFGDIEEYFNVPYLIDIEPYISYFPEDKGKELPNTMLLLKIDKLNTEKKNKINKGKIKE